MAGVPEIVGGLFTAATVILNAASETGEAMPSLTDITIPDVVPALVLVGVPVSAPVPVLNVAQLGLLAILNVSVLPFGSLAVGLKL